MNQIDVEAAVTNLLQSSKCLYLELHHSIADDVAKKANAVVSVVHTQAEEIELLKQIDQAIAGEATDRGLEIVKLREKVERLKAHTLRLESSLQKTEARYNENTERLESSLHASEARYKTQAAQLLKAQAPKMTWGEANDALYHLLDDRWDREVSQSHIAAWVCDFLRQQGVLAEDAPVILTMEEADALEPVDEQPTEVDPLKVDMEWMAQHREYPEARVERVAQHLNTLVEVFRASQRERE